MKLSYLLCIVVCLGSVSCTYNPRENEMRMLNLLAKALVEHKERHTFQRPISLNDVRNSEVDNHVNKDEDDFIDYVLLRQLSKAFNTGRVRSDYWFEEDPNVRATSTTASTVPSTIPNTSSTSTTTAATTQTAATHSAAWNKLHDWFKTVFQGKKK